MAIKPGKGKATPLTVSDLLERVAADEKVLAALLPVAAEHVESYAARAPVAVKNEAVTRFTSYLATQPSTVRRLSVTNNVDVEFVVNHAAAFRNSGAAMLLAPWRIRRAGVV